MNRQSRDFSSLLVAIAGSVRLVRASTPRSHSVMSMNPPSAWQTQVSPLPEAGGHCCPLGSATELSIGSVGKAK